MDRPDAWVRARKWQERGEESVSKSARLEHRRQRAAELARRQELARKRRRLMRAGGAVSAVLAVILVLIVVKVTVGGSTPPAAGSGPASDSVLQAISSVPADVFDQVGLGKVDALPKPVTGQPPLTADGKPLIVYIGAEYCPYCAAQRWGFVLALSRFGSFANLGETKSGANDAFPNTATLSFHGASYTSQYLSFQGVETASNVQTSNGYAPLDTLTAQQQQLMSTYNAPPYTTAGAAGSIPFIDIANKYLMAGASISPGLLAGKAGIDIADIVSTPNDPIAQGIDGAANAFTAALCDVTGGQPGAVCQSSAVTAYTAKLHAS
jgi:Domain of unknown function (DUF929)